MEALIPARNLQSYNHRAVTERSQRKNSSWKPTEYQISSITTQKFINVSELTFSTFESLWKSFSHTHADPASSSLLENLRKISIIFDCLQSFYYGKFQKKYKICVWKLTFFNFSAHLEWFWIVTNCSIFRTILSDLRIGTLPKAALLSLLVRLWTCRALYPKKTRKVCKSERKTTKTITF